MGISTFSIVPFGQCISTAPTLLARPRPKFSLISDLIVPVGGHFLVFPVKFALIYVADWLTVFSFPVLCAAGVRIRKEWRADVLQRLEYLAR